MAIPRPCPSFNLCQPTFGPVGSPVEDFPLANISSEAPDPPDFVARATFFGDPPINHSEDDWKIPTGTGFGNSTITQQDAQDQANGNAQQNTMNQVGGDVQAFPNDPQTCGISCPDGQPFVNSVPAGIVFARTLAEANARALSICQTRAGASQICFLTSSLSGACKNSSYNQTISASGGTPAYQWSISSGVLPPGITLNSISGSLSGTPTVGGSYSFTVTIVDSVAGTNSKTFTITIIEITTTSPLSSGIVATAYSQQLASNPSATSWTLTDGALPTGLSLSSTGLISGTPTVNGDYSFTVQATVGSISCTKVFALKIWDTDNTLVLNWGDEPSATRDYQIVAGAGPGIYKVEYVHGGGLGNAIGWAWLGAGNYNVWTTGHMPGGTDHATTPYLYTVEDGSLGNIVGSTNRDPDSNTARNACTSATQAANPVLRFELLVARNIRFHWDIRPAIFFTDPEGFFLGGIGPIWNLTRIGKP